MPIRIVVADIDEEPRPSELPIDYLERVVADKLDAIARQSSAIEGCAGILVADTIVRIEDRIIGKPSDTKDALSLLQMLSGREHIVHTRYAIASAADFGCVLLARTVTSTVQIRSAPRALLERYADTGEGLDKAGGYAVQGIGAFLVERIVGSYSNVVGLPVCEVVADLLSLGLLVDFP